MTIYLRLYTTGRNENMLYSIDPFIKQIKRKNNPFPINEFGNFFKIANNSVTPFWHFSLNYFSIDSFSIINSNLFNQYGKMARIYNAEYLQNWITPKWFIYNWKHVSISLKYYFVVYYYLIKKHNLLLFSILLFYVFVWSFSSWCNKNLFLHWIYNAVLQKHSHYWFRFALYTHTIISCISILNPLLLMLNLH